jgi:hypothetical protein
MMYLKPGPPYFGRMIATAATPSDALSGAITKDHWPTDACVAMAMPSAKQAHGACAPSK